jgi:hypothetical protein
MSGHHICFCNAESAYMGHRPPHEPICTLGICFPMHTWYLLSHVYSNCMFTLYVEKEIAEQHCGYGPSQRPADL